MPALLQAASAVLADSRQEWFSVEQLELLSPISKWTWRRWAQTGVVASAKVSTRLLISRAEFDRVMAEASRPRAPQSAKSRSARRA
jgi:hypothetical protein